ncbi:ATP/GTP-binding protein [Streptomyces kaniharaensis]|uniref:ATP/GTP-binding protein n=1 Tax=Streptomyces kaniharaensis TaxID=212423 RepID=A0A6N7L5A9_9ACTN|nr:ATP/GTP-binding protein [Streptomyces kaniharaensis]MQS17534.1 ATP/GTP-binding protein [Streptomyces kaniharaensis]
MALAAVLGQSPLAWAGDGDGGTDCPPGVFNCDLHATGGGKKDSNGGGGKPTGDDGGSTGGGAKCLIDGKEVACFVDKYGWYNPSDSCYWKVFDPQPPPDSERWKIAAGIPAGWKPGQGALYNRTCLAKGAELMSGDIYSAAPPPGMGGMVDPAQLAQQAVESMRLLGADVGIAPKPGSKTLVGLPVWFWTNVSDTTWGPKSASVSAGGVTVTATAHVDRIIWTTGDGGSETCRTPGKAYLPEYGTQQPECGHTYTKAGQYAINATSKWVVDWTATTGQTGRITTDRQAAASVAIAEAQALNTN